MNMGPVGSPVGSPAPQGPSMELQAKESEEREALQAILTLTSTLALTLTLVATLFYLFLIPCPSVTVSAKLFSIYSALITTPIYLTLSVMVTLMVRMDG